MTDDTDHADRRPGRHRHADDELLAGAADGGQPGRPGTAGRAGRRPGRLHLAHHRRRAGPADHDSVLDADRMAAVRGAPTPELLTFEAAGLTVEVETVTRPTALRLLGQLVPAQRGPGRDPPRAAAPPRSTADDMGRFTADGLQPGPVSLRCRTGRRPRRRHRLVPRLERIPPDVSNRLLPALSSTSERRGGRWTGPGHDESLLPAALRRTGRTPHPGVHHRGPGPGRVPQDLPGRPGEDPVDGAVRGGRRRPPRAPRLLRPALVAAQAADPRRTGAVNGDGVPPRSTGSAGSVRRPMDRRGP